MLHYPKILRVGGVLLLSLASYGLGLAQYAVPRVPKSLTEGILRATQDASLHSSTQDTIQIAPLTRADIESQSEEERNGFLRIASSIELNLSPLSHGQWLRDKEGGYVWHCVLSSRGAKSLGIQLQGYKLPKGAALYVYGKSGRVRGAFTEQNNTPSGILQIAPVEGDVLTLEYELPQGMSPAGQGTAPFRVAKVSRGFRSISDSRARQASIYGFEDGEPYFNLRHNALERIRCAERVVQFPEWSRQSRAVLLMMIDGELVASAVLMNNTNRDGTAYVLTSAHCINQNYRNVGNHAQVLQSVASAVFFFGFESPSPQSEIRGTEELSLSGATLVAYNPDADMALLKITGLPTDADGVQRIPASYNAYYAGWNSLPTPSAPYVSIHHPLGSTKRYSLVDGAISIEDYSIPDINAYGYSWYGKHWFIKRWAVGTTAAGSSGSPLLDKEGHVIGALSGGISNCSRPTKDYYWAVSRTWDTGIASTSLAPWLDPANMGVGVLDGYDPHEAEPIQRLSYMYGKGDYEVPTSYQARDGIQGVAQHLNLSNTTRPLGGYIVFEGNLELQQSFPSLTLELRKLSNDKVGEVEWSTQVSSTAFRRYNANTGGFESAERTIAYDSIELFLPSLASLSLPAGDYILGLRTSDGSTLKLPLLQRTLRTTTGLKGMKSWSYGAQGWQTESKPTLYWLDLLVEGAELPKQDLQDGDRSDYIAYYHAGYIYAYNPLPEDAELFVYNISGELIQRATLPEGETRLTSERLLPSTPYVVYIKGGARERGFKIFKTTD